MRVAGGILAQLLERGARLILPRGECVDLREHQPHLGTRRVELARTQQLLLRILKAAALQIDQAEVGEAERILGREIGELLELGLGLGELIPLEVAEPQGARGVELLHGRGLLAARAGAEQQGGRENGKRAPQRRRKADGRREPG